MNIIKNILKKFENFEQASINVTYCAVDDLFYVALTRGNITTEFSHPEVEAALGDAYEYTVKVAKQG